MVQTSLRLMVMTFVIAFVLAEAWKNAYPFVPVNAPLIFLFVFVGFILASGIDYIYRTLRARGRG